ncbi:MAG: calcium/sodium antiporter [Patescibacteria group bacterium]|nr:calcium/sodium antiporter [Patescibacteria group bacterium]
MLVNHALFFFIGLLGLWLGSELITNAAQVIAKKMGLSEAFIGLTVLAIGTDFPEIMIAIDGAINKLNGADTTGLVVGNIIGSSMSQITLVLGVAGLLKVFKMKKKNVMKNGVVLIAATLLLFLLAIDGELTQADGLIMVVSYLVYFFTLQRKTKLSIFKGKVRKFKAKNLVPAVKLIAGLVVLAQASELVLDHGVEISQILGVSQMIVGVIMIGLGTSLPELIVSISAVIKGSNGLSIGNLIGSNIVDILVALGASTLIAGWQIERSIATFDLAYLLFSTVIVVLFLLTKETLEKRESILLICLYAVYVSLKVLGF